MVVCLSWTAGDLLCFGPAIIRPSPADLYYPRTPAIEWLQKDESLFRIFGGGTMLTPNSAEVFGLSDARGCDFMAVRRYEELITGHAGEFSLLPEPDGVSEDFPAPECEIFVVGKGASAEPAPHRIGLFEGDLDLPLQGVPGSRFSGVRLSSGTRSGCRFSAVSPPRNSTRGRFCSSKINRRREDGCWRPHCRDKRGASPCASSPMNRMTSELTRRFPAPGYLLLLDTYFPGWSATVNGEPAPILRADYNFRAVSLPAGRSTVCFSYRPESLPDWLVSLRGGHLGARRRMASCHAMANLAAKLPESQIPTLSAM